MLRTLLLMSTFIILAPAGLAADPIAVPDAISIQKSEGAYLTIFPDGSAKAGFGALPHCAETPKDTFDFEELLKADLQEDWIIKNEKRTPGEPYIAVGFVRGGSAVMHQFGNKPLIDTLFKHAEQNARIVTQNVGCPFSL